ncbi:RNA methyltransferase [Cryptosporangium japonicum]|uniref:RNA methyltransferase n=1 Tax=Cryptosporangium japonicum TaxID=80872 RepID=A0ABN0USV2_9ACTN
MTPIEITDPDDPRIADYRALTDVALREAFEPPHGLFIAEGELVLKRAVRAGYRMRSILVDAKRVAQVDTIAPDAPLYAATPAVLEAITGFHVHRGVLGSVHRPAPSRAADLLGRAKKVLILEDVNTHTNVGAIFRVAAGLGMDAILLSPSCADPLYRRSVRVSMGEVFAVPYARLDPWPGALDSVREAGFTLLALTPDPGAISLRELSPAQRERPALLLGAEGPGLSGSVLTAADARVRIPMHRGVDSLNVATAAAVACYELGG